MAVHSFSSIAEIARAKGEEERSATREKVLVETRVFDKHLRNALAIQDGEKRKSALLKLEELPEFKRSHPTVEVRIVPKSWIRGGLTLLAFYPASRGGWRSWRF